MDRGWIKEKLKEYLTRTKKIAVVPMGKWGRICKEILEEELRNELENKDVLYLDNYCCDDDTVYPIERAENWHPDRLYLIAAMNENVQREIETQLLEYVDKSQLLNLFTELVSEWTQLYGKIHLDFLCCGFVKCCTSSLHVALKQNSNIFLPEVKESHFIENIYWSNAHRRFHRNYPSDLTAGKIVGGIEPAYYHSAKTVRDYFGENLKLLFCVRDPVKALYSLFRMRMRDGGGVEYYLEKYKKITPDVFDEWIERESGKEMFLYIDYIKEYLKYYSKNKIKIVIVEEMLRLPNVIMGEIQEHIGLERSDFIAYEEMPSINNGAQVPRDLACAYVNQKMMELLRETEEKGGELFTSMQIIRYLISQITNEEYNCEMNKGTENRLRSFYKTSICEMEQFIGKSLKGVWY